MRGMIVAALLIFLSIGARAESPRHFVYLFALDDGMQTPTANHTWASFVEVEGESVRTKTIDWLPASKIVRPLALGPERGKNFPASYAFDWAERDGLALAEWGPYEISDTLYELASNQLELLSSGDVWYRVVDTPNRIFKLLDPPSVPTPRAVMCIHAVSDVVTPVDPRGFLLTGLSSGIPATAMVAWHFKPWYLDGEVDDETRERMDEALRLDDHPSIQRRSLERVENRYCRTLEECRNAGM